MSSRTQRLDLKRIIVSDSEEESSEEFVRDAPFFIRHWQTFNVILVFVYIGLGIATFVLTQGWQINDAVYVFVQVITTVGYGDLTCNDLNDKMLMAVFVLFGTIIVANVVNDVFNHFLQHTSAALERNLETMIVPGSSVQQSNYNLLISLFIYIVLVLIWVLFYGTYEACTCYSGDILIDGCVNGDTCSSSGGFVTSYSDAFYAAVITYATVGFGDYAPRTEVGRAVASVLMLLGVLAYVNLVTNISSLLEALKAEYRKPMRVGRTLFDEIDEDGNGFINKDEFRNFMLVKQNVVSLEMLQHIDRLFEAIDADASGRISYEEISGVVLDN